MDWTRSIRAELRISQKRLGDIVDIPPWRINAIESGRPMQLAEIAKILSTLGEAAYRKWEVKIKVKGIRGEN